MTRRDLRWNEIWPYLFVFLIAITCSSLHIARYREFSPIDELRHLDYAVKISHGQLTHFGDKIGEIAMREEMCRGLDLAGWTDPPCRKKRIDPVEFRDDGWQTASPHPPLYYLGAGLTARLLGGVGITDTYVAGARLFSAVTTALGIVVMFYLACLVGVRKPAAAASSLSILVFPSILHSSGIVTPDSASLLMGAMIAVAVVRFQRKPFSLWWLALLGVAAGATKLTNLFAASAGALYLLGSSRVLSRKTSGWRDASGRRMFFGAVVLFAAAAATTICWLIVDSARATIDPAIIPQNVINHFKGWPSLDFLLRRETALRWFPPSDGYIQANFSPESLMLARWLLELMIAGGAFACLLRVRSDDSVSLYVSTTALTAVVGAPLFSLATTKFSETLVQVQGRYGLSLLPVMVVGLASVAQSVFGRRILVSFGAACLTMLIICLVNAPTLG